MKSLRIPFIRLRWREFPPKILVLEEYEKYIKWILRLFTLVGISSSIIAFPNWYSSLLTSLILLGIEQFLEKSVFLYTTIYVQPLPNFDYIPDEWMGMAFFGTKTEHPRIINAVGLAFGTKEYARNIFNLFRSWNYNKDEDIENNICLSFIIEEDGDYSTYVYPNPDRKTVVTFFNENEELFKYEKYGKEQLKLLMQIIFCKQFPFGADSYLKKFIETQTLKKPFWLQPFLMGENNQPIIVNDIKPILKYHFKYKQRKDLGKNEYEYLHGKNVMKL